MSINLDRFYKDKAIEFASMYDSWTNTRPDGTKDFPFPIKTAKNIYDTYFSSGESPMEKIHQVNADPSRFMESIFGQQNYSLDSSGTFLKPLDYQLICLELFESNKNVAILAGRQMGITSMLRAYALWFCLQKTNATIFILTPRASTATELINDIKALIKKHLFFPYMDITTLNKNSIRFSNGSSIIASSDIYNSRGRTINLLIADGANLYNKLDLTCIAPMTVSNQIIFTASGGFDGKNPFTEFVDKFKPEFVKINSSLLPSDTLAKRQMHGNGRFQYDYEAITPDWKEPY